MSVYNTSYCHHDYVNVDIDVRCSFGMLIKSIQCLKTIFCQPVKKREAGCYVGRNVVNRTPVLLKGGNCDALCWV